MADRPTERRRLDQMTDDDLDALYADLERARDVAVALENENARLEAEADRLKRLVAISSEPGHAVRRAERAEQQLAQRTALLAEFEKLTDITHKHAGRHDCLGAGYTCAGCDLRDRARAALDGAQQPGPAGGRELRPCGQRNCLPNGPHRYMLGCHVYQCPGAQQPATGEGGDR